MLKHKTHSGASKRFKKLKSGLIKAKHAGLRHNLTKKTRNRKKDLRKGFYLVATSQSKIASVL